MPVIKIRNPVLRVVSAVTVGLVTMVLIDTLIFDDGFVAAAVQGVLTAVIGLGMFYVFIRCRDEPDG